MWQEPGSDRADTPVPELAAPADRLPWHCCIFDDLTGQKGRERLLDSIMANLTDHQRSIAEGHRRLFDLLRDGRMTAHRLSQDDTPPIVGIAPDKDFMADFVLQAVASLRPAGR